MTTAEHTKTPIESYEDTDHYGNRIGWGIRCKDGVLVSNFTSKLFNHATLERLVLCYNSHDALVAALKLMRVTDFQECDMPTWRAIQDALALAERTES